MEREDPRKESERGLLGDQREGIATERAHPIMNWTSFLGLGLVGASATSIVFAALLGSWLAMGSGYGGLASVPIAGVGLLGLGLALVGVLRERRRRRRGSAGVDPRAAIRAASALALVSWLGVTMFGLLAASAGGVALVEATESNAFCSQACHSVMQPEATAYLDSAHARIDCVNCHVGDGAESFVRAKLSGLRQVYGMLTNQIPRPIPTPIRNRRSSREMCESCHTPEHFIGEQALVRSYYRAEGGEPIRFGMLLHVGGSDRPGSGAAGIHDHMLRASKVEYVARDPARQEIAWVRATRADGSMREFTSERIPLRAEDRTSLPVQRMECFDCHSRPAHAFAPPVRSVDEALAAGTLPASLPRIKEAAVRALDGHYDSTAQAMAGIAERLQRFYAAKAPGVLEASAHDLERAGETLRAIYRRTIFPEMKADWRAHPDNLGHLDFPGCFRCHSDEMVDASGENSLFLPCTSCHGALASAFASPRADGSPAALDFVHPADGEAFDDEEFTLCTDCHDGGAGLYR